MVSTPARTSVERNGKICASLFHTTAIRRNEVTTVKCPPFAESITEGDVRWEVEVGDSVSEDQVSSFSFEKGTWFLFVLLWAKSNIWLDFRVSLIQLITRSSRRSRRIRRRFPFRHPLQASFSSSSYPMEKEWKQGQTYLSYKWVELRLLNLLHLHRKPTLLPLLLRQHQHLRRLPLRPRLRFPLRRLPYHLSQLNLFRVI